MQKVIIKRDGSRVPFDETKIVNAIEKAFHQTMEINEKVISKQAKVIADLVVIALDGKEEPSVEEIQDIVEEKLAFLGFPKTAKAYILYRAEHTKERSRKEEIMDVISGKFMEVTTKGKDSVVTKGSSGNANVDTEGAMGKMLSYGAETSKILALEGLVSKKFANAHTEGDIHIHDLDFLPTKTLTCCQIDIEKLFKGGFSTGHGFLREPQSIGSYAALAAIAIQANQNDQHGGQSIPAFDYYMAPGVLKTFKKEFARYLGYGLEDLEGTDPDSKETKDFTKSVSSKIDTISYDPEADTELVREIYEKGGSADEESILTMLSKVYDRAYKATEKATYQAMEGFVHNLNTMHSRAGAQVPFSSINYGTDTSPEGRMVIKNLLLATEAGLGNGETPIFP